MQLIDKADVIRTSIGLALTIALSSLITWKSGWLVSPFETPYGTHASNILMTIPVYVIMFLWSYMNPRSLRLFLERILPPVTIIALLYAGLMNPGEMAASQVVLSFVIPTIATSLFMLAWIFLIAAQKTESGILSLLLGWALSFPLRMLFESIGDDAARMITTALLASLMWVLLLMQSSCTKEDLPIVVSNPRKERENYIHSLKRVWVSVLVCGTFAFLGGVTRSLSLQVDAMEYINFASALAGPISALALAIVWRFQTVRFSLERLFVLLFPPIVFGLCVLPFCGMESFAAFAAILYVVYSFTSLSTEVVCIQTSDDCGVNPVFLMSFHFFFSLCMQGFGFALGGAANAVSFSSVPPLASVAIVSLGMMALVLFVMRCIPVSHHEDVRVELLSLSRPSTPEEAHAHEDLVEGATMNSDAKPVGEVPTENLTYSSSPQPSQNGEETPRPRTEDASYVDLLSTRCKILGERHYLSQREIEVMTLFVRGYTMSAVAKELFISDNTVKTHVRRIYAKLDIHKKQELFDLVENLK